MEDQISWGLWGEESKPEKTDKPVNKRGSVAYYEIRPKYLYQRAFSELQLINCIQNKKLEQGTSYNFITAGDVDQISYLRLVLKIFPKLDYLLFSTWCLASEDILYLFDLVEKGVIKKMDAYVGEIFKNSYPKEYEVLKHKYSEFPVGRICLFKNHSKVFAGLSECGQGFGVQTSANMNTNPRTENGCITIDNGIYEFYKSYFDGINSFEK